MTCVSVGLETMDKGAHYYRCDLQVHTPRDLHWTGKECVSPEDRRAYAESLVCSCREKKIQGIAITDHHDWVFAGFVRRAAQEETDDAGKPLPPEKRDLTAAGQRCRAKFLQNVVHAKNFSVHVEVNEAKPTYGDEN